MLEKGEIVGGKYEIISKIGEGGMSYVYLAIDINTMYRWAVKEVRRDGEKDFQLVRQNLTAERDILTKLSHPNLPRIIDVIENDDSFFIVMDYIEGETLMKLVSEKGAQREKKVIEWAKQLCDVLQYLHTRKPPIVYRDMKPSNVMLRKDGSVCLIDFGTAREYKEKNLADTRCLGTFGYAAPEQFGGFGQTDARTDIYCLGATLYHLVTGINPADPPYEIRPIREFNEKLSPALEEIIIKCTQSNPDDRYQSCAQLKKALEDIDNTSREYDNIKKKKVNTFLVSIIATLMGALAGVTGLVLNSIQKSGLYSTLSTLGFIMFGVCLTITVVVYFMLGIKKTYRSIRQESLQAEENRSFTEEDAYNESQNYNENQHQEKAESSFEDVLNASATTEIDGTRMLNIINSGSGRFLITKNEMIIHTDKVI